MTYIYERKQASDLFHDLKRMGRDNFTYDGAKALMDYLEELAGDTGEPMEYDPIAFCCEYQQFDDIEDYVAQYSDVIENLDQLREKTQVIEFDGGFIIQNF